MHYLHKSSSVHHATLAAYFHAAFPLIHIWHHYSVTWSKTWARLSGEDWVMNFKKLADTGFRNIQRTCSPLLFWPALPGRLISSIISPGVIECRLGHTKSWSSLTYSVEQPEPPTVFLIGSLSAHLQTFFPPISLPLFEILPFRFCRENRPSGVNPIQITSLINPSPRGPQRKKSPSLLARPVHQVDSGIHPCLCPGGPFQSITPASVSASSSPPGLSR